MKRYSRKTEASDKLFDALLYQDAPIVEILIDGEEPWWVPASDLRNSADPVGFIARGQNVGEEDASELIARALIRFVE